jgi:hypothetical protein
LPRDLRSHRQPRSARAAAFLAGAVAIGTAAAPLRAQSAAAPTIAVDVWAIDAKGEPVVALAAADLDVRQDGVAQTITRITPRPDAGVYELQYVPSSGRPGAMTVRPVRKGLLIRGPGGSQLKPRVIPGRSAMEAELLSLAESAAAAPTLPCTVAAYRFGPGKTGVQYVGALEIAMPDLARGSGLAGPRATAITVLQIVGRLRRDDGKDERIASYERSVQGVSPFERLVWTSYYDLPAGGYTFDAVVRDLATLRVGAGRVRFEVPPAPGPGLRMSSVVFLQHGSAELAAARVPEDPLFYQGEALLPALKLELPLQEATASARFFVELYPDPRDPAPPTLEMEVSREGQPVGRVPITLPPPKDGRISFMGYLPTRTFRAAPYLLKLIGRQGPASVAEEATLVIRSPTAMPAIRIEP